MTNCQFCGAPAKSDTRWACKTYKYKRVCGDDVTEHFGRSSACYEAQLQALHKKYMRALWMLEDNIGVFAGLIDQQIEKELRK